MKLHLPVRLFRAVMALLLAAPSALFAAYTAPTSITTPSGYTQVTVDALADITAYSSTAQDVAFRLDAASLPDGMLTISVRSSSLMTSSADSWYFTSYSASSLASLTFSEATAQLFDVASGESLQFTALRHLLFEGNTYSTSSSARGGAIGGYYSTITLSGNESVSFSDNTASSTGSSSPANGGAIYGNSSSSITLSDNGSASFSGNRASSTGSSSPANGGAIFGGLYSRITLSNNGSVRFSENTASTTGFDSFANGGAINGYRIILSDNESVTFSGNTASTTGRYSSAEGGAIDGASTITLSGNGSVRFSGNTASSRSSYAEGGAIYGASITLSDNESVSFSGNTASGSSYAEGGAILGYSSITLSGNGSVSFSGNLASSTGSYTSDAYGGAIYGDYCPITLSGNGSVTFSGNMTSSSSSSAYGGAIYADGNVSIQNNDSVLFEKNVEQSGSAYRLRSIYAGGSGDVISLSAAEGKSIEFRDSVYIASGSTFHLNADYTDGEGVVHKQAGDIIFTGAYTEADLLAVKGRKGTAAEILNSRTSEVYTLTHLYGGRLRVEDGAIYQGYGITAVEGSNATVRVKKATLNHAGHDLTFHAGTSLSLSGNSLIFAEQTKMMDGSALVLDYTDAQDLMIIVGNLTLQGSVALIVEGADALSENTMLLYVAGAVEGGTSEVVTIQGVSYHPSQLTWVGNLLVLDYNEATFNQYFNGSCSYETRLTVTPLLFHHYETLSFENILHESSSDARGGAIYGASSSTITLSNNENVSFSGNTASSSASYAYGGAIYGSSTITLSGNESVSFSGNTASSSSSYAYGGAIDGDSTITLSGNESVTFSGNTASSMGSSSYAYGGAIYGDSTITLSGNGSVTFSENTASSSSSYAYGGAIGGASSRRINLSGNGSVNFSGNTASSRSSSSAYGGAIYGSSSSTITLSGNGSVNFSGNTASSSYDDANGGAIYGASSSTITLSGNEGVSFSGNTVSGKYANGGAIYGDSYGLITLSGNGSVTFSGNRTSSSSSSAYGGAIYGDSYRRITLSGNGSVNFSGNRTSSSSASAYGGAIYADGNVSIQNNDSVLFEKNVEKSGSSYRLRSIYAGGSGDVISLSAAAGKSIEFRDSVYIASGSTFHLNADYTDAAGVVHKQAGDIIFTGAYTEADLLAVKGCAGTENEITLSRTSTVNTMTKLYGGCLRVEDGAIYQGYGITAVEGSNATVRVKKATLNHTGYDLTFHAGTSLSLSGNSSVFAAQTKMLDGSALVLDYTDAQGLIEIEGKLSLQGSVTLDFEGAAALSENTTLLYVAGAVEGWTAVDVTIQGVSYHPSQLTWVGNLLVLDYNEDTFNQYFNGSATYTARHDASLSLHHYKTLSFENILHKSSSDAYGGAIDGSSITLSENESVSFSGNTASSSSSYAYGGAIYGYSSSTIILSGNESVSFSGNTASSSSSSYAYGGAIDGSTITLSGNGSVEFSGNTASGSSYAYGGAIRAYGHLSIRNNDSVLFEKNVEQSGSAYRLRSIYAGGSGDVISLSAAEGKSIEFRDSVYIASGSTFHLNADYTDDEGVVHKQAGDIIFTGAYTEADLLAVKGRAGTAAEILNSLTSEVYTLTNLYGGRLRVEDGAIYKGYGITAMEGSGATVRVKDAILNHAGYNLTFTSGSSLVLGGQSTISGYVKMQSGSSLSILNQSEITWQSGSSLQMTGALSAEASILGQGSFIIDGSLSLLSMSATSLTADSLRVNSLSGGSLTLTDASASSRIDNSATLSGAVDVAGGLSVSGSLTAASLKTKSLSATSLTLTSSSASNSISNNATLRGAVDVAGTLSVGGCLTAASLKTTSLSATSLTLTSSSASNSITNNATLSGAVDVAGALSVGGSLTAASLKSNSLSATSLTLTSSSASNSISNNATLSGAVDVAGGLSVGGSLTAASLKTKSLSATSLTLTSSSASNSIGSALTMNGAVDVAGSLSVSGHLSAPTVRAARGLTATSLWTDSLNASSLTLTNASAYSYIGSSATLSGAVDVAGALLVDGRLKAASVQAKYLDVTTLTLTSSGASSVIDDTLVLTGVHCNHSVSGNLSTGIMILHSGASMTVNGCLSAHEVSFNGEVKPLRVGSFGTRVMNFELDGEALGLLGIDLRESAVIARSSSSLPTGFSALLNGGAERVAEGAYLYSISASNQQVLVTAHDYAHAGMQVWYRNAWVGAANWKTKYYIAGYDANTDGVETLALGGKTYQGDVLLVALTDDAERSVVKNGHLDFLNVDMGGGELELGQSASLTAQEIYGSGMTLRVTTGGSLVAERAELGTLVLDGGNASLKNASLGSIGGKTGQLTIQEGGAVTVNSDVELVSFRNEGTLNLGLHDLTVKTQSDVVGGKVIADDVTLQGTNSITVNFDELMADDVKTTNVSMTADSVGLGSLEMSNGTASLKYADIAGAVKLTNVDLESESAAMGSLEMKDGEASLKYADIAGAVKLTNVDLESESIEMDSLEMTNGEAYLKDATIAGAVKLTDVILETESVEMGSLEMEYSEAHLKDASIGSIRGTSGQLSIQKGGSVTVNSDVELTAFRNEGTLNLGKHNLTVNALTNEGGNVIAGEVKVQCQGSIMAEFDTLIADKVTVTNSIPLGRYTNDIVLGDGSVIGELLADTLVIKGGTVTLGSTTAETRQDVNRLELRDGATLILNQTFVDLGADFVVSDGSSIQLAEGGGVRKGDLGVSSQGENMTLDPLAWQKEMPDSFSNVNLTSFADTENSFSGLLTQAGVVNEGAGAFSVSNADNKLNEIRALNGDVVVYNQSRLDLKTLEIGDGLNVSSYSGERISSYQESSVTVSSSAIFGQQASLNANLTMKKGSVLSMDGALTMGSTLSLASNMTLDGELMQMLSDAESGTTLTLFEGVDDLMLNGKSYSGISIADKVMAWTVFENLSNLEGREYYFTYTCAASGEGTLGIYYYFNPDYQMPWSSGVYEVTKDLNVSATGGELHIVNDAVLSGRLRNTQLVATAGDYVAEVAADIVSGSSVEVQGGHVVLSGHNSYTGGTVLHDGTLEMANAQALGAGKVELRGGTLHNNSGEAATLSPSSVLLAGAELQGDFAMAETAAWDVQADTHVGGSLDLLGGSLTLHETTLQVDDVVSLGGAVFTLVGDYELGQAYTLIYAGEFIGDVTNLTVKGYVDYAFSLNEGALTLVLREEDLPKLTWANAKKAVWKTGAAGWFNEDNQAVAFTEGAHATIGDGTVTIDGVVKPSSILLNPTKSLTFKTKFDKKTGLWSGAIDGEDITLTIAAGPKGKVTMNDGNTYTGTTTIKSGTVNVGGADSFGESVVTLSGGTLDLKGKAVANAITLAGEAAIKGGAKYEGEFTMTDGELLKGSVLNVAEKATLVNGEVSGTLSGTGTVYVTGEVELESTAKLTTNGLNISGKLEVGSKGLAMNAKSSDISVDGGVLSSVGKVAAYSLEMDDVATVTAGQMSMKDNIQLKESSTLNVVGKLDAYSIKLTDSKLNANGNVSLKGNLELNNSHVKLWDASPKNKAVSLSVKGDVNLSAGSTLTLSGALSATNLTLAGAVEPDNPDDSCVTLNLTGSKLQTVKVKNCLTLSGRNIINLSFNVTEKDVDKGKSFKLFTFKTSNLNENSDLHALLGLDDSYCSLSLDKKGTSILLTVTDYNAWMDYITPDTNEPLVTTIAVEESEGESATTPMIVTAPAVNDALAKVSDTLVQTTWGTAKASRAFVDSIGNRGQNATALAEGRGAAWGGVIGATSRLSSHGGSLGADHTLSGAVFGAEMNAGAKHSLGMAMGVTWGEINTLSAYNVDQDSTHFALYGQSRLMQNGKKGLTLDWSAAYGRSENDADMLGSSYDWTQHALQLDARLTYGYALNERTTLRGFGGLQYLHIDSDTPEKGVKADSMQNVRVEVGVGATYMATAKTAVYGEVSFIGDMVRDNPATHIGGVCRGGSNPGRAGMNMSVGATHALNENWSLNASYNMELQSRANAHNANVGASYRF